MFVGKIQDSYQEIAKIFRAICLCPQINIMIIVKFINLS